MGYITYQTCLSSDWLWHFPAFIRYLSFKCNIIWKFLFWPFCLCTYASITTYRPALSIALQLIFRDFKTSNILLDEDFNAKLSDFGFARHGPAEGVGHVLTSVSWSLIIFFPSLAIIAGKYVIFFLRLWCYYFMIYVYFCVAFELVLMYMN